MATPSLAMIPSAYADSKVYSVLPNNGDGDFTFDRASSATRVGQNGLIETVLTDIPRLNYDISNGVVQSCPSLLVEPASTNLINYSQAISNSPVKAGAFVDNFAISPDGTQNATKLTAQNTDPFFYQNITFAAASYTSSIYVKGIGDSIGKDFRISIGSFTTAPKLVIPSEWTRFEFTATLPSGSASTGIEITDPAIVGDEVLVWGWQVEQQSYATSYIPTLSGSSQTRAAETCNDAGTAALFNDSEGVLYLEIATLSDDLTNRVISVSDGSSSNKVQLKFDNSSNQIEYDVSKNGVSQVGIDRVITDTTNYNKIACKWKANDFTLWVNGVEIGDDTIGSTPIGLSDLSFDDGNGNSEFYGKCKDIRVYNEALTDAQLITLTTL